MTLPRMPWWFAALSWGMVGWNLYLLASTKQLYENWRYQLANAQAELRQIQQIVVLLEQRMAH